jgi:anti-sigma factor RsiW
MTQFRPPGASLGGASPASEVDEYALWDAAYVLGSLSSADRREYEAHLSTCPSCRESVSELNGMPALLAQLTRDDVAGIDEHGDEDGPDAPPPLSPLVLTSLLAKVSRRRRRSRLVTWTVAAAAAAVLVIGVLVSVQSNPVAPVPVPPQAESALTMTRVAPTPLNATVTISGHGWGTRIEMNCTYGVWPENSDHNGDATPDKLAMVVQGRDGSQSQLATWVALTGTTATPGGSTSMPIDQIASVQIVSAENGDVLLQRNL